MLLRVSSYSGRRFDTSEFRFSSLLVQLHTPSPSSPCPKSFSNDNHCCMSNWCLASVTYAIYNDRLSLFYIFCSLMHFQGIILIHDTNEYSIGLRSLSVNILLALKIKIYENISCNFRGEHALSNVFWTNNCHCVSITKIIRTTDNVWDR